MKKRILKDAIYFVIWYIIFNAVFTLTEFIILRVCGLKKYYFTIFPENMKNNVILFLIVYIFVLIAIDLYDKIIIQKLNEKLKKIKERRKNWWIIRKK